MNIDFGVTNLPHETGVLPARVSFTKGCYPGQEIVARAQYRGQVKRRMVKLPAPAGAELKPGQDFNGGVVVDSAGGEVLAVMPLP